MTKVVDVRFRTAGKAYRFDVGELVLSRGDHVIVDNQKGKAYATVVSSPHTLIKEPSKPLRKVVRIANEEDEAHHQENLENEKKAYQICKGKIAELGLDMKLVSAEQAFTGKKMIFYFTADERVDFRELVKALASEFHTRIEMRQIGVRDETTMCGGIGVCGRELCCCTYLTEFAPVSIKMAKAQNLSLNPGKISGTCGRLMCCLRNEAEAYEELNKTVPKMGEKVKTPEGTEGTVTGLDVLRQRVKVVIQLDEDNKELHEYAASELTFKPRGQKKDVQNGQTDQKKDKSRSEKQQPQRAQQDKQQQAANDAAKADSGDHPAEQNDQDHDGVPGGNRSKDAPRGRRRSRGRRGRNRPRRQNEGQSGQQDSGKKDEA